MRCFEPIKQACEQGLVQEGRGYSNQAEQDPNADDHKACSHQAASVTQTTGLNLPAFSRGRTRVPCTSVGHEARMA